jgi:hypothetical protein
METVFNIITPFYKTILWLNMRTNSKGSMILGSTKLEYHPFNSVIKNSGLETIMSSINENKI